MDWVILSNIYNILYDTLSYGTRVGLNKCQETQD